MRICLLAALCLAASACGIKGPLVLPQRSSPVPQQSHRAQPAAPAAKTPAQSAPAQSEPAETTEKP